MEHKNKFYSLLIVASLLIILNISTGCSKRYQDLPEFLAFPIRDVKNESVGRFKTSYMADQIDAYFQGNLSGPIAVTTFVDLDNLYQTSTFGRILAEQMISELSMRGYKVVELRMAEALQIMHDRGEFGLSRDISTLKRQQDISTIVVGTYVTSPDRVYINARLIDPKSSYITSVGSVEMAKTDEINRMVRSSILPQSMERIPVRHLGYGRSPEFHFQLNTPKDQWIPEAAEEEEEDNANIIKPKMDHKKDAKAGLRFPTDLKLDPAS